MVLSLLIISCLPISAQEVSIEISKGQVGQVVVKVPLKDISNGIKVMIEKEEEKYFYDLKTDKDTFPLQLGSGQYNIKVLENTRDNMYKVLKSESIDVEIPEEKIVFLASAQPVKWNNEMKAMKIARNLALEKSSKESIKAIYEYVINNIRYDTEKIDSIDNNYIPDIERILEKQSGICYDYSVLFAGMARSIGIPTKLVKGYKNDIAKYHAWNEVFLDGKWIIIDTTYDSCCKLNGADFQMEKGRILYKKVREY